jgi:hypothetical protein
MSTPNLEKNIPEHFYDDLIGIELFVPCSTWDKEEAEKCWGEDYSTKFARGVKQKVSMHRKKKEPRFEIKFPEKKFQNTFVGFQMDYILSYSEEVPLKYHHLKAEYIKESVKKAEMDILATVKQSEALDSANGEETPSKISEEQTSLTQESPISAKKRPSTCSDGKKKEA